MRELDLRDNQTVTDIITNGKSVRGVVEVSLLDDNGDVLFTQTGENELLIGGAIQIVKDMTGFDVSTKIHKLDADLGLSAKAAPTNGTPPRLFGMIVSTDGSTGIGSVTPVERKEKGYDIAHMIPFRITDTSTTGQTTSDDEAGLRQKYGLRVAKGTDAYYYVKFFEKPDPNKPETIKAYARTVSGIVLPDFPDTNPNISGDVEAVIEMVCEITKDECNEFFIRSTGIDSKNISSIALVRGYPYAPKGHSNRTEYHTVTVSNRRNFPILNLGKNGAVRIKYSLIIK